MRGLAAADALNHQGPCRRAPLRAFAALEEAADSEMGMTEILLGAGESVAELSGRAGRPLRDAGGGLVRGLRSVTTRLVPAPVLSVLAERNEAARSDLDRLVDATLGVVVRRVVAVLVASVDLTALVRDHVDLDALAAELDLDTAVARVDLDAAIARVDLVGIAREVIDAIDLPNIVRDSTGTMASDVVRTARVDGMRADDVVAELVDRVLRRPRVRTPPAP